MFLPPPYCVHHDSHGYFYFFTFFLTYLLACLLAYMYLLHFMTFHHHSRQRKISGLTDRNKNKNKTDAVLLAYQNETKRKQDEW